MNGIFANQKFCVCFIVCHFYEWKSYEIFAAINGQSSLYIGIYVIFGAII